MWIISFLIFLTFPLALEALHSGSCSGLVCGSNGNCHSGPVNNSNPTFWCRCDEGFGGDFCEQKCGLKCEVGEKCVFNESLEATCVCQDCDKRGVRHLAKPNCPSGYGGNNCETPGWCYPDLCRNGGQCIGAGNRAKCVCPHGFRGDRCQIDVDECKDSKACGPKSTCMNTHGSYLCVQPGNQSAVELKPAVCFLKVSEEYPNGQNMYCQHGGYCDKSSKVPVCQCPPGFHGSTCEISQKKSDTCEENPCSHGTCFAFPGGVQCICDDGYHGSFCEEGQDNCIDNKCEAESVCINGRDSYQCDCPPGRTGQYCEKVDCTAIPGICNHGHCLHNPLSDKTFECQCEPGFEGELCDMDINECLLNNICLNNGTCVNLQGSFRCDCPRGFGGKFCEEFVDTCKDVQCDNGGGCVLTSNRSPICQCRNGFVGRRCEKECPLGFGGVRCDIRLNSGVCSRYGGKCFNNGKCISGFCACPPDFTGNQCELTRKDVAVMASENTCETDPCMNNATCIDVDAHIGYVCLCKQGFEGDICERRKDFCLENPCANGGICEKRGRSSFACICPAGFKGDRCEKEQEEVCKNSTCMNGGICHNDGTTARCECSYGFSGQRCEQTINLGVFFDKETLLRSVCEKRKCWERANDGNCDADCNYAACKFDGGDCSGKREPFSRCNYGNMCADLFSNGVCDQACNNEDCLYDGMDCMSAVVRCPAKIREYCAARFANGICNPECNTDGCGFDGGDCANHTEAVLLTDIRINIQMETTEFQVNGGQAFMELSSTLRAAVRIQRDEEGPLVFEWDGEKELGRVEMDVKKLTEQQVLSTTLARRIKRSLQSGGHHGIVAYLEVQEDCVRGKCLYTDSQSVVDIISARLAKKGTDSFGVPISEAMIATPRKHSSPGSTWNNMIIIIGLGCVVCVGMAGVLTVRENRNRKRKMINAPVWIPPMEHEEKNRKAQSMNSSQHSLLDANGYYDQKRHCAEFGVEHNGQYHHLYQQGYSYGGDYGVGAQVHNTPQVKPEPTTEEIPLHMEASGSGRITQLLTRESVNQEDSKYRRRVLHWLAANTNKKPEETIAREAEDCLNAGADVNALDCDENTALMLAVKSRRTRLAIVLMRGGADPTIYNKFERSALHEAAVNSDLRMMELLLRDQRLVKDIDELDRCGRTVLMEVARSEGCDQVEMARLLLGKGAKIDSDGASRKDSEIYNGRTALHYAALNDNLPMVEFLVAQNANKDKQDEAGHTPIMLAAKEGHERIVITLIRNGASIEAVDALDHSARQLAQDKHYHNIVEIFDRYRPELEFSMEMAMRHQHQPPQATRKAARPTTFKPAKKTNRKAKEAPNSRDSTHLTPPPSDGSTSSPSPQHFITTTHTTPTSINYMSPEYQPEAASSDGVRTSPVGGSYSSPIQFQPQCSVLPNGGTWYTASPTYPPMQNEPMMHHHPTETAYYY